MAKVKFKIVGGGNQTVLKLGKNEKPPDFYEHELGALQMEDKAVLRVLEGLRIQTGHGEKVQAWKKEHGRDGWILCAEKGGTAKMSFGDVNADEAPETVKNEPEVEE